MRTVVTLALLVLLAACKGAEAPEAKCTDKCVAKTASRCSNKECSRGCAFILDRIVEREDDHVLACLSTAKRCDDPAWAECAAAIGAHAPGAPPVNTQTLKSTPPDEE